MVLMFVALGGLLGALVRWGVEELLPQGVLIVNVFGSALLGGVLAVWQSGANVPPRLMDGLVGFCGSLTTFSAIAFTAAEHIDSGSFATGIGSLALQFALGIPAAWLGFSLCRRWKAA